MTHGHGHDHGAAVRETDRRRLLVALGLIVAFMAFEVAMAVVASSLALLSDAAHMLTDAAALVLALVASRLAARPARGVMTYGLGRVEILSAQVNGVTLLILALFIVYEAIARLIDPPEVEGLIVLVVALVGVVVNLAASAVLAGGGQGGRSLNVEGAFQHILTDAYAFIATALAGAIVLATGFARADPLASLVVAGLMLRSAYGLLKASGRVFLEAAPEGLDPHEIGNDLARRPGVVQVHDLHVWEVTSGFPALSAHVVVRGGEDCHDVRRGLARHLADAYGLTHTTLQVDHEARDELLSIEDAPTPPGGPAAAPRG
ncbi:MAG TPA: cation diffusion facilitator family transporter [Solirubrobacteraceae bacterium]|nr:cation diffusion facilitator family transporter [Solirubrobacteraceae bacterium]